MLRFQDYAFWKSFCVVTIDLIECSFVSEFLLVLLSVSFLKYTLSHHLNLDFFYCFNSSEKSTHPHLIQFLDILPKTTTVIFLVAIEENYARSPKSA